MVPTRKRNTKGSASRATKRRSGAKPLAVREPTRKSDPKSPTLLEAQVAFFRAMFALTPMGFLVDSLRSQHGKKDGRKKLPSC